MKYFSGSYKLRLQFRTQINSTDLRVIQFGSLLQAFGIGFIHDAIHIKNYCKY